MVSVKMRESASDFRGWDEDNLAAIGSLPGKHVVGVKILQSLSLDLIIERSDVNLGGV